jgi:hypothetical protein
MFCANCRKQIEDHATFCTYCGNATDQENPPPPVMNWEHIAVRGLRPGAKLDRARVPGGWLVWVTESESIDGRTPIGVLVDGPSSVPVGFSGLTFYPDPDHAWNGG